MNLYYTLKLFLQFVGINCKVKSGRSPYTWENFTQITQTFVISWYIDDIATNFPIWKHTLRVFTRYFQEIVGKGLFWCFIYVFVWICCISCHVKGFLLLNATLWLIVTHTIMINGPKLADWSKLICITLWNCFGSLLTTKWEVSTGRLHYSIITFTQITQKFVISSIIDNIETNLPIGKHTLRVIRWHFEKTVAKALFWCFIYVFVSIGCILCHFQWFMLFKARLWLTVTHTFRGNRPKLAD